ncbi:hypothetical protein [Erythrobacter sp. THAF29]|uniref:hypothetical protein n=1 Tax=Erythrobacter sp. THAF29 TaxID=2587851 RepID=UPI001F1E6779|nr:hypothetical protein [Erythrobacter sp. THAF29]
MALASAVPVASQENSTAASDPYDEAFSPPVITSERDAERLRNLEGATLQWLGWEKRGKVVSYVDQDGVWWLTTELRGKDDAGLKLEGVITEIGKDYFLIHAEITIMGTPDPDRFCDVNKIWRFAVTQNRSYYRLREFEWCDGLTDYIDFYFAPSLR